VSFGTTGGRGFEVPGAHYIWGAVILLAALVWVWSHFDHKRHSRDADEDNRPDGDG
jgi:hypothetical protein